jgi:hypothetical protein
VFLPVPGGLSLAAAERLLAEIADSCALAGAGFTGLEPDPGNLEPLRRLAVALGLG